MALVNPQKRTSTSPRGDAKVDVNAVVAIPASGAATIQAAPTASTASTASTTVTTSIASATSTTGGRAPGSPASPSPALTARALNIANMGIELPALPTLPVESDESTDVASRSPSSVKVASSATTPRSQSTQPGSPSATASPASPITTTVPKRRILGHLRSNTSPNPTLPASSGVAIANDDTAQGWHGATPTMSVVRVKARIPKEGAAQHATNQTTKAHDSKGRYAKGSADKATGVSGTAQNVAKSSGVKLAAIPAQVDGSTALISPHRRTAPVRREIALPEVRSVLNKPGAQYASVVSVKGSWFMAFFTYDARGDSQGGQNLPSFVSTSPPVLTDDGSDWIEVMMCLERCLHVRNGACGARMPLPSSKPIFRGNPRILWNGKEIFAYDPLVSSISANLAQTQLAKLIVTVSAKIAQDYPGTDGAGLEKRVFNIAQKSDAVVPDMDLLEPYTAPIMTAVLSGDTASRLPLDLRNRLIVLDHQIVKLALASNFSIDEIDAARQNAIVQFLVTRGISKMFPAPEASGLISGSSKAVDVLSKAVNKELNKLGYKVSAGILKTSSSQLPKATREQLAVMRRSRRTAEMERFVTSSATKKAKRQQALAAANEARGPQASGRKAAPGRSDTGDGLASPARSDAAKKATTAKKKLLKAVYGDSAFGALSPEAQELLKSRFEDLKAKGLDAEKIEIATRKLLEKERSIQSVNSTQSVNAAGLEGYLAILEKRRLLGGLYADPAFTALPQVLQDSLKGRLDALTALGLIANTVEAAGKEVIAENTPADQNEASLREGFAHALETGRWRPDGAANEVELLMGDTWDLNGDDNADSADLALALTDIELPPPLVLPPGDAGQPQPQPQATTFLGSDGGVADLLPGSVLAGSSGANMPFIMPSNPFDDESGSEELFSPDAPHSEEKELEKADRRKKS